MKKPSKMSQEEINRRIEEDADFVALKRFDYSLDNVIRRYPDGTPSHVIARALCMTEEQVRATWVSIVQKLRNTMRAAPAPEKNDEKLS